LPKLDRLARSSRVDGFMGFGRRSRRRAAYSLCAVVWLGRIVGAILGFAIGILLTEVIFSNNQSWPDVVPFALAVVGIVAGSALGRRFANRNANPS